MRAKSAYNFTTDDLYRIVETCRRSGVKSYLTVNTIIYDEDLTLLREILYHAHQAQVTAVIAADVATLMEAHSLGLEVHLSTQLNISNWEALRFYAQFADVVVLARELNLDQVAEIRRKIAEEQIVGPSGRLVEIEMFAHGALCMAVSIATCPSRRCVLWEQPSSSAAIRELDCEMWRSWSTALLMSSISPTPY